MTHELRWSARPLIFFARGKASPPKHHMGYMGFAITEAVVRRGRGGASLTGALNGGGLEN